MIRAICYDMDGVLVEARDWHFNALNRALSLFGAEITRHEHLTTFDGLPTRKKLQMLTLEGRLPEGLHELISRLKQRFTHEEFLIRCHPIFRHQYALIAVPSGRLSASDLLEFNSQHRHDHG